MRELMELGRERWPEESDGEIIRRYMDYGGRYLALRAEREGAQNDHHIKGKRG